MQQSARLHRGALRSLSNPEGACPSLVFTGMAHLQPQLLGQDQRATALREPHPLPQPDREEERPLVPPPTAVTLLPSSHSPIEHLKDNSYLVVHPEHPNLAETAEESSKGCFVS